MGSVLLIKEVFKKNGLICEKVLGRYGMVWYGFLFMIDVHLVLIGTKGMVQKVHQRAMDKKVQK